MKLGLVSQVRFGEVTWWCEGCGAVCWLWGGVHGLIHSRRTMRNGVFNHAQVI